MARKRNIPAARPTGRRLPTHVLKVLLTLLACGGLIAAVAWFGSQAGERIADQPRYTVPFVDLESDAPPGSTREHFLSEVRYLSNAPQTIQVVDPKLAEMLAPLFRRHPWVEEFEGVDVAANRTVHVRLRFRVPVLVVRVTGSLPAERLVDAKGVLLPTVPAPAGVAVLGGERPAPTTAAGQVWDDPLVRRAAELAREFHASRIEKTLAGWRVTQHGGKVWVVSP